MAENDTYGLHENNKLLFGKLRKEKIDQKMDSNQLTTITKDILSNDIRKYLNDNVSQDVYACFEKAYAKKISNVIVTKGNFIAILNIWKDQNDNKVDLYFLNFDTFFTFNIIGFFSVCNNIGRSFSLSSKRRN